MHTIQLLNHPATPSAFVRRITVDIEKENESLIWLRYILNAEISMLRIPAKLPQSRTDSLWRHTCFEAFVSCPNSSEYIEFNLSPSGKWAAYRFENYREGMIKEPMPAPQIDVQHRPDAFEMEAKIDLATVFATGNHQSLWCGLSAVIEDTNGNFSYWALAHPASKPDFHHRESFALALGRPGGRP